MSYFHRPHGGLQEADAPEEAVRSPFSELAGRFANWTTGRRTAARERGGPRPADRAGERQRRPDRRPAAEPEDSRPLPLAPSATTGRPSTSSWPSLERELDAAARQARPDASITEEIERIGEQTASILVVAHDQAHETTRPAQEQAERCVADAAANAVEITAEAKERLRELDEETDAVWRERERLLEDVRVVSAALANLANQASERFPAAEPSHSTGSFPTVPAPAHGIWEETGLPGEEPEAAEPEATQPFNALQDEGEQESAETQPGDTGSWLVGLEPPDLQSGR